MKGKTLGRVLGVGLAIFGTKEVAKAGGLFLDCKVQGQITNSDIYVKHITGATESYDNGLDSRFLEAQSPAIDFYSKVPFDPYKLSRDARPPESMTTINSEIHGRDLSGAINGEIDPLFWEPNGENNFVLKTIRADLYDASDNLLASYDVKNLAEKGETIPITVNEGLTYKMKIRFYDIEDLNLDRIVDFKDYAEFAKHWKTSGHDMYNNWANGADFNKDGYVNAVDLAKFVEGWLLETESVGGE